MNMETTNDKNLLWEQYNLLTELYKFYLNLVVQTNLLIFAVIAGIATYIFSNPASQLVRWSLFLPIILSSFFAVTGIVGARLTMDLRDEIIRLKKKLNLGLAPHINVLVYGLFTLGALHFILAVFMIILFFNFETMVK